MNVDLTFHERNLLLAALRHQPFHDSVALPQTQHVVRETYKAVRDKLKALDFLEGQKIQANPVLPAVTEGNAGPSGEANEG